MIFEIPQNIGQLAEVADVLCHRVHGAGHLPNAMHRFVLSNGMKCSL
jgi:hypothetical protein